MTLLQLMISLIEGQGKIQNTQNAPVHQGGINSPALFMLFNAIVIVLCSMWAPNLQVVGCLDIICPYQANRQLRNLTLQSPLSLIL